MVTRGEMMGMREIKFRARNAHLPACWIYGYFVIEKGSCFIINDDGKFSVIAGTECQFTGLYDKNGKEIFEGDILLNSVGSYETVKWSTIKLYDYLEEEPFYVDTWNLSKQSIEEFKFVIIGNIYKNPALIEK